MNSLDLFSCVGCHAIGFARAGIETVAFCEINLHRHLIIADHFPDRPIYKDVRTFDRKIPADIIIGGPPCQRTSVAAAVHGYRSGESLWPHMLRIGLDVGAEWFVVEQPPGNATWETQVGNDLSRAGRHVARLEFGCSDLGAPYLRRRVFLVACSSLPRLEIAWRAIPSAIEAVKRAADARGDWSPDQLRNSTSGCSRCRRNGPQAKLSTAREDRGPWRQQPAPHGRSDRPRNLGGADMTPRERALADGYKDETCPRCGAVFEAQIHFIRCDAKPCPMVSTKDPRTLLERFRDCEANAPAPKP